MSMQKIATYSVYCLLFLETPKAAKLATVGMYGVSQGQ